MRAAPYDCTGNFLPHGPLERIVRLGTLAELNVLHEATLLRDKPYHWRSMTGAALA